MLKLDKTKKYLLGCSFGPDSMALLNMLLNEKFDFEVAHVNYHLRMESDEETEKLIEFCLVKNIKIHIFHNVDDLGFSNLEEKCREIRYTYFKSIFNGFDALLIAHNQDDLLETYLLQKNRHNIVQYYGLNSVSVLYEMKVNRPLLSYSKQSLLDYCINNKVPYAIDKTNLEDNFERNKIRHSIVGKLNNQERNNFLKEIDAENNKLQIMMEKLNQVNFNNVEELKKLTNVELAVLLHKNAREIDPGIEFSMKFVLEIRKILDSKKPNVVLKYKNIVIIKEYKNFKISENIEESNYCFVLEKPGELDTQYFYLNFLGDTSNRNVQLGDYPLVIRNAKPDDLIIVSNYQKKFKRLCIDWKLPISKRNTWPLIVNSKGKIVYIPRYSQNFVKEANINFYVKT